MLMMQAVHVLEREPALSRQQQEQQEQQVWSTASPVSISMRVRRRRQQQQRRVLMQLNDPLGPLRNRIVRRWRGLGSCGRPQTDACATRTKDVPDQQSKEEPSITHKRTLGTRHSPQAQVQLALAARRLVS